MIQLDDENVDYIYLLDERPPVKRINVIPFALFYILPFYLLFTSTWLTFGICFGIVLSLHLLTFLLTLWSVNIKSWINYRKVKSVEEANFVYVQPKVHCGNATISQLVKHEVKKLPEYDNKIQESFFTPKLSFSFQHLDFCCYNIDDKDHLIFKRLDYPDHSNIGDYIKWQGLNLKLIDFVSQKYSLNDLSIPLPKFLELFKEHVVAPFFVLQIFCVVLWSLDDYWYLSLFTFVMLIIFESTLVWQRINHIKNLREMRPDPYTVYVYRDNVWVKVQSDQLYPGDIISVTYKKKSKKQQRNDLDNNNNNNNSNGNNNNNMLQNTTQLAPCDLLLINGTCIVNEALLTGESIPQTKEGITNDNIDYINELKDLVLTDKDYKRNIIYGGTELLQCQCPSGKLTGIANTPNRGCLGFVIRTGYYSSQGELIRTMLYSSERVTANNNESFLFIGILLVFAVLASGYVLYYSINDPNRNKWKLLLHCIMIITTVVPPELPMELSLNVTASMAALTKLSVFCTEPFRIPFAGKVTKCCFDKTGTITSDEITVDGVVKEIGDIKEVGEIDEITLHIMIGCQSLVFIDNTIQGDPLELAAVNYCGWVMTKKDTFVPSQRYKKYYKASDKVVIIKINSFTSELKRMSTVIQAGCVNEEKLMCVCKGAPDVLESLFIDKPSNYREIYRHYSSGGKRVIALGYKFITKDFLPANLSDLKREDVESDLIFSAFLILDSPLKHGSKKTIKRLLESSHELYMITGDDPLTACAVANKVHMINKGRENTLILTVNNDSSGNNKISLTTPKTPITPSSPRNVTLEWIPILETENNKDIEYNPYTIRNLSNKYDLCITGPALSYIIENEDRQILETICDCIYIYARTSPQDKGTIISTLKELGYTTLMCGDGTNDVGALKQADVGVSILNNPELEKKIDELSHKKESELEKEKEKEENEKGGKHRNKKSREDIIKEKEKEKSSKSSSSSSTTTQRKPRKDAMEQLKDELTQSLVDEGGVVKLGDASIASPFTCKSPNIDRILHIIRQGRCTLVTTIQMYKILALNCLTNAYFLSILYLLGAKQGDTQATVIGIITAMYFFLIARSKPLSKLSVQRPDSTIFNVSALTTILGQFIVHLYIFYESYGIIKPFIEVNTEVKLDEEFTPTLLNTIMYIISTAMMNTTFLVNYQGHPFMSSIQENQELLVLLAISFGICLAVTVELIPDLNQFLELSPIPEDIQQPVMWLIAYDTVGCYILDYVIKAIFTKEVHTKQELAESSNTNTK